MGGFQQELEDKMLAREIGDNPYAPEVIASARVANMEGGLLAGAAAISEAAFQDKVVRLAKDAGWMVYHTYDSRRSEAGFPDLVLAHRDHGVIFAELKSASGKLTPAQQKWQNELSDATRLSDCAGDRYIDVLVWRPADWDSGCIAQWLLGVAATSSPPPCPVRG